ncbi:MAG: hypothetical protein FJY56_11200 [Betaproteobacteria bacterium]|nr:hypothetical protein [Betaproteobacteria bacterium]
MTTKNINKIKHLCMPSWWARRALPAAVCASIETAIRESETQHRGEICFVAETSLFTWGSGVRTVRERAIDVFAHRRVWDTAENTGVLIYLQLIDHDFEIVADRGISARLAQGEWDAIAARMEAEFRAGRFEAGILEGLREIGALLKQHFPAGAINPNELPDRPIVR